MSREQFFVRTNFVLNSLIVAILIMDCSYFNYGTGGIMIPFLEYHYYDSLLQVKLIIAAVLLLACAMQLNALCLEVWLNLV